eukprot:GHVU01122367.1.p2 GENE.GHVU01122367.1~~GHVU01122367.1.p2  ORF type:complete len:134 (+),score=7.55 GHVU01122367.1:1160-1561(+)
MRSVQRSAAPSRVSHPAASYPSGYRRHHLRPNDHNNPRRSFGFAVGSSGSRRPSVCRDQSNGIEIGAAKALEATAVHLHAESSRERDFRKRKIHDDECMAKTYLDHEHSFAKRSKRNAEHHKQQEGRMLAACA